MCRKLETEEEKILPFYSSSLTTQEEEESGEAMARPPSEPIVEVGEVPWYRDHTVVN